MVASALVRLIRLYQYLISPLLGSNCRFHPTCSHYGAESLSNHGLVRGGYMAARRLLKCHPFHPGGFDPVPEPRRSSRHPNKKEYS